MKLNLAEIWKALGLPVGLTAVLSAVLYLFGINLEQVFAIAGGMLGVWALLSVVINILKITGVVNEGTAGKWSAVLNLVVLGLIAYMLKLNPAYDFSSLDKQLVVVAQFGVLVFGYLTNVIGTKAAHVAEVKGLGIKAFTFGYSVG